ALVGLDLGQVEGNIPVQLENSSEVSSQSTRPSLRAMKPSRLAAMWIVTRESALAIVSFSRPGFMPPIAQAQRRRTVVTVAVRCSTLFGLTWLPEPPPWLFVIRGFGARRTAPLALGHPFGQELPCLVHPGRGRCLHEEGCWSHGQVLRLRASV